MSHSSLWWLEAFQEHAEDCRNCYPAVYEAYTPFHGLCGIGARMLRNAVVKRSERKEDGDGE